MSDPDTAAAAPQPAVDPSRLAVLVHHPDADAVRVVRDVAYADGPDAPCLDLYLPPPGRALGGPTARPPVVVLVAGYPEPSFLPIFGRGFRALTPATSWARLLAASGLAAVVYGNREPVADLAALVAFLQAHGADLGVDPARLGLLASSGHVPTALGALMDRPAGTVRGAVLAYGFMLDAADAARTFGFADAPRGRPLEALAPCPLLVVRALADRTPGLDASLVAFVAAARAAGRPLELLEVADAPHAFDLIDDRPDCRAAIARMVAFLVAALA